MKYDVFISYSRKDTEVAESLCKALDRAGVNYWIDRNIHGSANFLSEITRYIRDCKVVLFIASSNSAASTWTQKEILYALKFQKHILPYRIGDFNFDDNAELDFVFMNVQWIESEGAVISALKELDCCNKSEKNAPTAPTTHAAPQTSTPAQATQTRATAEQLYEWGKMGSDAYQEKNYTEAVKWYRKAAEQGYTIAQHNLGTCYYYGHGVAKDYAEAVKWYRKAAEQGLANAQYGLGLCYEYGYGVAKDYTEAVNWYRKAAEQGHENAKKQLNNISGNNNAAKTYKVGDYYNENGKEGVVFDIWDGGKHGKIVSLDQAELVWCTQAQHLKKISVGATSQTDGKANTDKVMARTDSQEYPAFVWCRDKGKDWYLPSVEELNLILMNEGVYDAVNRTLESRGATKFDRKDDWGAFWTSTERNAFCAVYSALRFGGSQDPSKYSYKHIRAVSAF